MSKALKGISDRDWNSISETNLRSMWPAEVSPIDCNAGSCQTLGRQDRIINNECECCELFLLQVDRNDKGEMTQERLHSIVIYYSAYTKEAALSAARKLTRALGLSEAETATIGREPQQHFYWDVNSGKLKEIALMDVELTHRRSIWRIYVLVSRHIA
jgi:hypothetical protein